MCFLTVDTLMSETFQQMGLIEVHEENFEKVATLKAQDKKTLTAQEIIEEYKDVDPTVPPNIAPSHHVPFAIQPKLKAKLERLAEIGVLMPVDGATDWVSNLVIATTESGELRLSLDPQQLNKTLKREILTVHDDMVIYGVGDTEKQETADCNRKLHQFLQLCRVREVKMNKKLKLFPRRTPTRDIWSQEMLSNRIQRRSKQYTICPSLAMSNP